jgi:hypothetical protein
MFGFLDWFKIGAGILAGVALSTVYVTLIHDPQVASAAREGYVQLAEKTAAEAKATEMGRQRDAASQALSEASKRQQADELADQAIQAQTDLDTADYEKRLQAAGRACNVDSDDAGFILHH